MEKRKSFRRLDKLRKSNVHVVVQPKWRLVWIFGLLILWLICTGFASFDPLAYRLQQYPQWNTKPPVKLARGDLVYPEWFEGVWRVKTTLLDMTAPLAPDIETPGFEGNREYLGQPVIFTAQFIRHSSVFSELDKRSHDRSPFSLIPTESVIVADRAFNGLNLARAYLNQVSEGMGDRLVLNVKVDENNPNQQITLMSNNRQLLSTVTGRLTESSSPDRFITTEVFQQTFRGISQPYLNEVETTTDYHYSPESSLSITADQITAIYLSPQDPDYFKAGDRPVALYRYQLEFYRHDD